MSKEEMLRLCRIARDENETDDKYQYYYTIFIHILLVRFIFLVEYEFKSLYIFVRQHLFSSCLILAVLMERVILSLMLFWVI